MQLVAERKAPRRVLRDLQRYDSRLGIFWNPVARRGDEKVSGRWQVKEWIPRWGKWYHDLFWEGPDHQYRELPSTGDAIIQKLIEADFTRYTKTEAEHWLMNGMDEERQKKIRNRRRALRERVRTETRDIIARGTGRKLWIPKGGIKSASPGGRWDAGGRSWEQHDKRIRELLSE